MILVESTAVDSEKYRVYEFQGQFENADLFDGVFDPVSLIMSFKDLYLEGRKIQKDFTILEAHDEKVRTVCVIKEVILFDRPPRYIIKSK